MKNLFKILFVVSLSANLLFSIIIILHQIRVNTYPSYEYFNPNLNVEASSILKDGFRYDKMSNSFIKNVGDIIIFFNSVSPEDKHIYRSSFGIRSLNDSLGVVKWIHRNNGLINSKWLVDGKRKHFYVKGLKSGMLFKCVIDSWGLHIYFDYPYYIDDIQKLKELRVY